MANPSSSRPKTQEKIKTPELTPLEVTDLHRDRLLARDTEGVTELLDGAAEIDLPRERLCVQFGLVVAVSEGDQEIPIGVLKRVKCVEGSEVEGLIANALQYAAGEGRMDIVTKLVDEGADVNVRGGLALQAAAEGGATDVVAFLLSKGADVNAQGGRWGTALHAASRIGSREIVTRLLAEGAQADKQDSGGAYPLQYALRNQHFEIASLLIPESKAALASIKTSEWKNCYRGDDVHVELFCDPIPAIRKVSTDDFYERNYPLSAPDLDYESIMIENISNFMVNDTKSKRIFFLANGIPLELRGCIPLDAENSLN